MCRIYTNGWSSAPRDITIDEKTALLIDSSGNSSVVGTSTVYFMQAPGAPQVCQPGTPLTYQNIGVYRIKAGNTFNLSTWNGKGGTAYAVSANAGVLSSTQPNGSIY
jgi:cyanophycinase-like exopeptidase